MPKLRILPSVRNDLVHILKNVGRESGSVAIGEHVVCNLRRRCAEPARLPGTMGRARPELSADLRSAAEGTFVIYFRYTASHLDVVGIVDGRHDVAALEAYLHSALKQ